MTIILSCACGALAIALVVAARSAYLWRREAIEQAKLRYLEALAHNAFLQRMDDLQRIERVVSHVATRGVSNDQCN